MSARPSLGGREQTIALVLVLGGALAVLAVGLYLGPWRYWSRGGGPWVEILPATFGVWETRPLGDHFFLAFMTPGDFAAGRAYGHYSQPWLLLQYACLQPWRWLGVSYQRAQVAMCLPQFALLAALLAACLRDMRPLGLRSVSPERLVRVVVVTVAAAVVLTLPAFWVPFFRFNPEQYFFLPAFAFGYLAWVDRRRAVRLRDAAVTLLPIALLAPLFTPFLVVSWFVLWGVGTPQNEPLDWRRAGWLGAIAVLAGVVFELPSLIGRFSDLSVIGSGFAYRSGLDGSQRHFTSMAQALIAPSYPAGRAWQLWQWPVVALAAVAIAAVESRPAAAKMLRQLFISWVPLLWMVVVFPQLVSIHPYFFDFHISLGVAVCLVSGLQGARLEAWGRMAGLRLAIFIALAGLLMTNLIDLGRLGALPPGGG